MNSAEILVIDDEPQICRLLELTLIAEGYKVRVSHTAKDGIAQLNTHVADLVLLDLGLPDMSGYDVLNIVRAWYDKPVIILSARSTENDIVEALDGGANDYLVKPFRTGELNPLTTCHRKCYTSYSYTDRVKYTRVVSWELLPV